MSLVAGVLLMVAVTLVLLEVALRVAASQKIVAFPERATDPPTFYRDDHPDFGVWHAENARFRATSACFDVTYTSNSYGARDRERSRHSSSPRVVVLGDSFVEGIGVEEGERLTDILEQRTQVEHLNFGTAGNFSSTQEWRLYEVLASRFDHDRVYVFCLPNNDFIENDPKRFWEPWRYRPYLRRSGDSFEIYWPNDLESARRSAQRALALNRIHNAFYVYRAGAFVEGALSARLAEGGWSPYGYVGYEQFSSEDLERLLHGYRMIRDAAEGREVVIFTIPRLNEFLYFLDRGYPDRLPRELERFAAREPGIRYVDLLPGFVEDWAANGRSFRDYFHSCDGHWSKLGNQVAADLVLRSTRRRGELGR